MTGDFLLNTFEIDQKATSSRCVMILIGTDSCMRLRAKSIKFCHVCRHSKNLTYFVIMENKKDKRLNEFN